MYKSENPFISSSSCLLNYPKSSSASREDHTNGRISCRSLLTELPFHSPYAYEIHNCHALSIHPQHRKKHSLQEDSRYPALSGAFPVLYIEALLFPVFCNPYRHIWNWLLSTNMLRVCCTLLSRHTLLQDRP